MPSFAVLSKRFERDAELTVLGLIECSKYKLASLNHRITCRAVSTSNQWHIGSSTWFRFYLD